MTAPTDFHPIILFEDDLKPIYHALLAAGRPDLAMIIEVKTGRSESELLFLAVAPSLDEKEFLYDSMPIVSESSKGAYVSCWVWVSREWANEVAGEATEEALEEKRRAKLAATRRRKLCRRIARLKRKDKNALLLALAETLYGANLDPKAEWTQSTIEDVADRLDRWLQLRG